MNGNNFEIVRREFKHGKVAYGFQWNRTNHERIGKDTGDSASLWAHLFTVSSGKLPEDPFTNPFYVKASKLRLKQMSKAAKVNFRKRLERTGALHTDINHEIVNHIRNLHRARQDNSYRADHAIVADFLRTDPSSIAIEIPVWSHRYNLSGHIDLIRIVDEVIHVCDYKPGKLETTPQRFLTAIPQIAAYGEMMSHHLASTLRSALDAPLLPNVRCCIFDTHSSWHFGAEMFVRLHASEMLSGI
ncbi:MAG: PD-(D/E)XK nuclease family protein [Candidatus Thorarchaeota archaeon]|nr:PD-(D/E)XK nuclease family protein [Candidatus Thorarchaeota archaeon]MCK5239882.1 PD-(D/E)XK nuclease family protein [Candidatus Thorarchaeota archaeon]